MILCVLLLEGLVVWCSKFKSRMAYWADNIKFVKDILDSKYKKIDEAITDVRQLHGIVDTI